MDRNGYQHVGLAKAVFDKYESFEDTQKYADRDRWDAVAGAMHTLSNVVNSGNPKELAEAMFNAVGRDHRTLQAQTVATMLAFLSIYKDAAFDGRNQYAVEAAEKITQFIDTEHISIPLI